ncbi:uncharacterized protein JCM15063_000963 [Sporobolomyces koalae]|uniref:uncharacterized protein n=1 Tax=Sporobolomyces koalae TaxID=500713 RepID=UPI00317C8D0B
MPRQRQAPPSPISIPLPPNLNSASTSSIPLTSYLALPPPAPTPNFFLRLKRSASQLRSSSPTPNFVPSLTPPVSPTPSALLSPTLFPPPPDRTEQEERDRPFTNLAPRSPTTGLKPWLELPTTRNETITLQAAPARVGETREDTRWPLTPESPYTPLKEPYAPERHSPSRQGKNLVFPHKPKLASNVFPTFSNARSQQRRPVAEEVEDDSDVDAPLSLGPASPRRHSTIDLPLVPPSPRSPVRNGLLSPPEFATPGTPQTPPQSRPRSMVAPSPPPTSALPPIPLENSLGLQLEPPATPPRSLRTNPRITPNAPARPKRIFSNYPALSSVSPSRRVHFPNGPTSKRRPRTPFPPPTARPASVSSYASSSSSLSDRAADFDLSSSSTKNSFETSDSSLSICNSTSRSVTKTPVRSLQVKVHPPPPRPPRSPLRPISRSITPLPTLLQPSAFTSGSIDQPQDGEDPDEQEAIIRPSQRLSPHRRSTYRNSTYSLGTVDSREYYALMGFPVKRYELVTGIRGTEQNDHLVKPNAKRTGSKAVQQGEEDEDEHEPRFVHLGGLPDQVRENFMRMKFDQEPDISSCRSELDNNNNDSARFEIKPKFIASGSQDSLDDSFVLEMTEKMLWG